MLNSTHSVGDTIKCSTGVDHPSAEAEALHAPHP